METRESSSNNQIKQETESENASPQANINTESHKHGVKHQNMNQKTDSSITNSESNKIDVSDKLNEEDSKEEEDEYDFMEECTIYPGEDRRQKVHETPHKYHGIIKCIGSLITRYKDDALTNICETMWGTGTVIHIDAKKQCYVLSAAHNTHKALRECNECHKTTLSTKCKCNQKKTKKVSPTQFIKAESIDFQRRCITGGVDAAGYKFGAVIESYAIDGWKIPGFYKDYTDAHGGYDICIMVFQCRDEDINIYKNNCSDIELVCDPSFGKDKENPVCIYGYPGDEDKKNEMWGMGTAPRREHKLRITRHDSSGKAYVLNPDIDTTPGQSGAAIWSWYDDVPTGIFSFSRCETTTYRIYGVHTGGFPGSKRHDRQNVGSFIDIENLKWIKKQMHGLRTTVIEKVQRWSNKK